MKDNFYANQIVAHNLTTMLEQRHWSKKELQERVAVYFPCNLSNIFRWSSGESLPSDKYLYALSEIFNFPFPLWKDHKITVSEAREIMLNGGKNVLLEYQSSFALPNLIINGNIQILNVFDGNTLIGNLPISGSFSNNCMAFYIKDSFIEDIPSGSTVVVTQELNYSENDIVVVEGGILGIVTKDNQVVVNDEVFDISILGRVRKIIIDI